MDRRTFLKAAAGVGVGAAGFNQIRAQAILGGPPSRTPVEHIVVVMMENRSTDHYLGWYGAENPAFDGIQHISYPDLRLPDAPLVATENWGAGGRNNYHGRAFEDPSHGWTGGRAERAGGANNGWLDPATGNDEYALSYYDADDVPVWAQLVRGWQAYDRWHCSLLGPTQPNRYYLHSGQSGGQKSNTLPPELAGENPNWLLGWDWPTIWTLLDRAGVTGGYYFSNLPQIAFWGARHLNRVHHIAEYYLNCELGTLPQVTFIDPWYTGPEGLANDDHPHADIRLGQQFLSNVVEAFVSSPCYRDGALVITYDEWGGFFDHVVPPQVPDDRATPDDPGGAEDFGQIGYRIPSTIVSPWTRGDAVDHTLYEHSSIIKFISDNWGLPYLTKRHQMTNSIEAAFRGFTTYEAEAPFARYQAPVLELTVEALLDRLARGEEPPILPISVAAGSAAPAAPAVSDLHRLAEIGWFDNLPVRIDWRIEDSFLRTPTALLADVRRGLDAVTAIAGI